MLLETVVTHYGPLAFGLVVFLVVWTAVVKPTLKENKIDVKANVKVADTLKETAVMLSTLTTSMGSLVTRLERLERKDRKPHETTH